MAPDLLLPGVAVPLVLGIVVLSWLAAWRRRLPGTVVGQVKADISLAMLRALILLQAGLVMWLGMAAGLLPDAGPARWLALTLVAIGGVGFVARAALYWLRIKPELDRVSLPIVPASPIIETRGVEPPDE